MAIVDAGAHRAAAPALPSVLDDPALSSHLTLTGDAARHRLAAWVVVMGKGLTEQQRDRAVVKIVRRTYEMGDGLRNIGIKPLDELGHVIDPAALTHKLKEYVTKRGQRELLRMSSSESYGAEAGHAIASFDEPAFDKALAELETTGKITGTLTVPARPELAGDEIASWVSVDTPEALARYLAWRDGIGVGLTPEQAREVRASLVDQFHIKAWNLSFSAPKLRVYDDHGHLADLAELTLHYQGLATRSYGKGAKRVLMQGPNFGPTAGAALANFDGAAYRARLASPTTAGSVPAPSPPSAPSEIGHQ